MTHDNPERVNILGVGVSAVNLQQAVDTIAGWIERGEQDYVVVCPVYTVMLCQRDPVLRNIVNRAGLVTPDGMPLVLLSRRQGQKQVGRVYGPDLMLAFSALAAPRGYRHYFYGGKSGVPEKLGTILNDRFPGLQVIGAYSPPFRNLTPEEDDEIIGKINDANPDVVWVGLGSPKQDFWMAEHRKRLNAPVLIGTGAAFDLLTGRVPQAPNWMRRSSLEWLFRLLVEPRRLWRRYIIYNPLFMLHVSLQLLGVRRVHPIIDQVDPE